MEELGGRLGRQNVMRFALRYRTLICDDPIAHEFCGVVSSVSRRIASLALFVARLNYLP